MLGCSESSFLEKKTGQFGWKLAWRRVPLWIFLVTNILKFLEVCKAPSNVWFSDQIWFLYIFVPQLNGIRTNSSDQSPCNLLFCNIWSLSFEVYPAHFFPIFLIWSRFWEFREDGVRPSGEVYTEKDERQRTIWKRKIWLWYQEGKITMSVIKNLKQVPREAVGSISLEVFKTSCTRPWATCCWAPFE